MASAEAGPAVFICDACINLCKKIVADSARSEAKRAGQLAALDPVRDKVQVTEKLTVTVRCALCKQPLFTSEALFVEARGTLCQPCIGAIQAALTERDKLP